MITPRDKPPEFGVPVDFDTGMPLSQHQKGRLQGLNEAAEDLYAAMHNAEGSAPPGEHQEHKFQSLRMRRAADHLDVALMLAKKAALEHP
jgi:hypothetical protein